MAESSRVARKRKSAPDRNPIPPRETSVFERIHFSTAPPAKRFESCFMDRKVIDSYYMELEDFKELIVCGRSVRDMLLPWESALDLDERVYPNLVRVFYLNIEISTNRLDRIVTYVGGVPIEFDVEDLNHILGTLDDNHTIYTSRKALLFANFGHNHGVKNIYRRRDLSNDICALPFLS